jgi:hypothetical protein
MFAAGRAYLEALENDGMPTSRDILTYSSDDWTVLAGHLGNHQKELKAIAPPPWASEWHQKVIERAGLGEQMAKMVATGGIFLAIGFTESFDKVDAEKDAAVESASAMCGDFAAFARDWDALDGYIDGTPVATPID